MRKAVLTVMLFVIALPVLAQAQIVPWERVSFVVGAGMGVPLRAEEFATYQPAFYKVLNIEAEVFNNVSVYTTYDRAIFDPGAGSGLGQVDVTTWGGGLLLFARLNQTGSVRAGAKVGASSNIIEGSNMEWTGQSGLFVDIDVHAQAAVRFACDARTYSNSQRIESVLPQICLKLSPGKSAL